jgi:trehalose 6-phosphate phosphatase
VRYALSRRSRNIIREFAAAGFVAAFDFDGTLAPIVRHPDLAGMRPATRALFKRLCQMVPCLVLSGRSREDLRGRVSGCRVRGLAGNHGADLAPDAARIRRAVRNWARQLGAALPGLPGLWIEDKGLSLTVHYRQCKPRAQARNAVLERARMISGARLVEGKASLGVAHAAAPHKGDALVTFLSRLGAQRAVFVGDDQTDEDVFDLPDSGGWLLTVRVGKRRGSRAQFYLKRQQEIDDLLRLLVAAASRPAD